MIDWHHTRINKIRRDVKVRHAYETYRGLILLLYDIGFIKDKMFCISALEMVDCYQGVAQQKASQL